MILKDLKDFSRYQPLPFCSSAELEETPQRPRIEEHLDLLKTFTEPCNFLAARIFSCVAMLRCPGLIVSSVFQNPAMRLSDPRALMEAFGGQGWNVFFVSPEKNPQSGTVFFNDLPAAKEFLVTPVSAGGFLLKPYAFANPINDWYRVKK